MTSFSVRVSIGLPVYNGEAYIEAAIDSVLAQTFGDFELIVCDNASTDGTERICTGYAARDDRIRYYRNETNFGAAENFNRTFYLSSGAYFKWLAHDDILAAHYLERCVTTLDQAPKSVVLCFPRRVYITPDGRRLDYEPHLLQSRRSAARSLHRISFERLVRVCDSRFPVFAFGLMRSSVMRKTRLIGSYPASDLVFVAEMRLLGEFWEVPQELFFQRLHAATPDVLDRMTRSGNAAWFAPTQRGRFLMPEGKVLLEYVRAIRRAEMEPPKKGRFYCALMGYILCRPRRWVMHLATRIHRAVWTCWSRVSLEAVRVSKVTSVPLRLWVLSAGLRGRAPRLIALAVARPSSDTSEALLGFAAERLRRRSDPRANRLLTDWLTDSCSIRRAVATRVLGAQHEAI